MDWQSDTLISSSINPIVHAVWHSTDRLQDKMLAERSIQRTVTRHSIAGQFVPSITATVKTTNRVIAEDLAVIQGGVRTLVRVCNAIGRKTLMSIGPYLHLSFHPDIHILLRINMSHYTTFSYINQRPIASGKCESVVPVTNDNDWGN
jgi:hypothetical protein